MPFRSSSQIWPEKKAGTEFQPLDASFASSNQDGAQARGLTGLSAAIFRPYSAATDGTVRRAVLYSRRVCRSVTEGCSRDRKRKTLLTGAPDLPPPAQRAK